MYIHKFEKKYSVDINSVVDKNSGVDRNSVKLVDKSSVVGPQAGRVRRKGSGRPEGVFPKVV